MAIDITAVFAVAWLFCGHHTDGASFISINKPKAKSNTAGNAIYHLNHAARNIPTGIETYKYAAITFVF